MKYVILIIQIWDLNADFKNVIRPYDKNALKRFKNKEQFVGKNLAKF
jgi:hypothetical protein